MLVEASCCTSVDRRHSIHSFIHSQHGQNVLILCSQVDLERHTHHKVFNVTIPAHVG
jgi:hypothetical protein